MKDSPKILVFAGSIRNGSYNRLLANTAAQMLEALGATVTKIDLADFPLPLMNEDLEKAEGVPQNARKLKDLMRAHAGFLIACPEYNSSITPLLKNTLDWVSRPAAGEQNIAAFKGKAAGLISASPGALGGLRGLVHLRSLLGNIDVLVIPTQTSVPQAMNAFADDGSLKDPKQQASVKLVGQKLAELLLKLHR